MLTGPIVLIAQATAVPIAAAIPSMPTDVELRKSIKAREVRIEQEGPIQVRLRAEPGITDVKVTRSHPGGAATYRNLTIDGRLSAWLTRDATGQVASASQEATGEPQ